jgi:hypothetical protein
MINGMLTALTGNRIVLYGKNMHVLEGDYCDSASEYGRK